MNNQSQKPVDQDPRKGAEESRPDTSMVKGPPPADNGAHWLTGQSARQQVGNVLEAPLHPFQRPDHPRQQNIREEGPNREEDSLDLFFTEHCYEKSGGHAWDPYQNGEEQGQGHTSQNFDLENLGQDEEGEARLPDQDPHLGNEEAAHELRCPHTRHQSPVQSPCLLFRDVGHPAGAQREEEKQPEEYTGCEELPKAGVILPVNWFFKLAENN